MFSFNNELKELEAAILDMHYLGYKVLGHLNEQTLIIQKLIIIPVLFYPTIYRLTGRGGKNVPLAHLV